MPWLQLTVTDLLRWHRSLQEFLPYRMATLPNHPWHAALPGFAYDLPTIWTADDTAT